MSTPGNISTLFLDIGGVLLTDGWGHESRKLAAEKFSLDVKEMNVRHNLTFDTYELGKLTLDEYLDRIIFYQQRDFTKSTIREFMFAQSKQLPGMIELIIDLKNKYHLKIAVVSNEGRELNAFRIQKFKLEDFVDFFISSSYVHFRKPDIDMFKMALDIAHIDPGNVIYIEDQPMFVNVAESLGINGIKHVSYETTQERLHYFGLNL
jgi:putative hydrolase of the HAD superfamily